MNTHPKPRPSLDPTIVVLVVLVSSFAWVLVFPVRLTSPPAGALAVGYSVALAVFAVLLAAVLRAAVTPAAAPRPVILVTALLTVSLGLWMPTHLWAEPAQEPWAWMAGFVVGACAVASARLGVLAAVVLGAAALLGAIVFDGSVLANLGSTFGAGLLSWLIGWVLVWLLRLVRAAEAGQEAEAQLTTAHERLRMSRVLHDVLGHRLGIIALKAELAADLAATDPVRSAQESREVRELAAATLVEARQAVRGESAVDVQTQLSSAELVLTSAGIDTMIEVDVSQVPVAYRELLATVIREAVTNMLRHSDARTASFTFPGIGACPTLVIVNDGRRPDVPDTDRAGGTGLASLAARSAAAGARLTATATAADTFEVRLELCNPHAS